MTLYSIDKGLLHCKFQTQSICGQGYCLNPQCSIIVDHHWQPQAFFPPGLSLGAHCKVANALVMHLHIPNPILAGTEAICSLGGAVACFSLAITLQTRALAQPDL